MTTLAQATPDRAPLLRRALLTDAALSFVSSTAALVAAGPLAAATGIPAGLLQALGAVFLVYTAGLAYTATRPTLDRRAAWAFTILNFAWVALSVAALIFGWLPLTPAGFWVVVAQAVAVDLLAVAQYLGLRRSR
jgi:hypothetical protein